MENEKLHAAKATEEATAKKTENAEVATEEEVLRALTKILRREESEDTVVKLRTEKRYIDEGGKAHTEKSESAEIVELRPRLSDVIRAAELIGKSYGIFSERLEGSIALPLIICGEEDLK